MQNSTELHNLIDASMLFRNVYQHETEAILARLQPSRYERGVSIMESGVWHGRLHIIASGYVSVLLGEGSDAYVVARLGPGECFGEMSLITGELPTATIRTEEETMLLSLSQPDFLTLTGTCPTLLQNITTILTRRLTRTNQQILSAHTAELLWLALIDSPNAPKERSLAFHIADALAVCSHKRVLLLELCEDSEASSLHFATWADQKRPSVLECVSNPAQLQAHAASQLAPDGRYFAALATLTDGQEQTQSFNAGMLVATLSDLALHYDYLLLVTTQATPAHIVKAASTQCQRVIGIVAAEAVPSLNGVAIAGAEIETVLFIAHTPERPTIGLQDRYTTQLGQPITRLLPADAQLLTRCWHQQVALRQLAPTADISRAVDFVARSIAHQTIGIAFGGGGARGFAHLGVLERLLHYGVPLDYISACSSGIIIPGMHLIGKSLAESEAILLDIQRHIIQWNFPRTAMLSNRGLKRMLRNICGEQRFEDLATPFAMVAVDLATRAGVVLDRGLLWQAALASVALPGIFPPVLVGEHILMDAGMHDPVPIRLVRKMGADISLASELGGQEPPSLESATPWLLSAEKTRGVQHAPHIIDVLLRTYDLTMATIGMHSIREADVVIRPKLHRISLRQFSEGRKFVAAGREAVEQALPALREKLPWL